MNKVDDIETPAMVIDEAIALANIKSYQQHCNKAGLQLRPHIKTHKNTYFMHQQLRAGANGITCQKIGEAEIMTDAGANDILITFNIIGDEKLARLRALAVRLEQLSVTADNATVVAGLDQAFKELSLNVLVECDTGAGRCGVQSSDQAVVLAKQIVDSKSLKFDGLMTYPVAGGAIKAAEFMRDTVAKLDAAGIDCNTVSTGGTPDMWTAATHDIFTEYRIGTYIYNDRSLMARGTCKEADCAGRVHATIVSTPTNTRAIIDAGSKVLTSDLLGLDGYGYVVGFPDATIVSLSEEHGILHTSTDHAFKPGQRVQIIPNHVCVVSNMFDSVWLRSASGAMSKLSIDARGAVA